MDMKAVEARIREGQERRDEERRNRRFMKERGARIVREHNLRVLHMPRIDCEEHPDLVADGMTVVWRFANPRIEGGRRVVEFSVALQHRLDPYIKEVGRYEAANRFNMGQFTMIRVPADQRPEVALERFFDSIR